MASLVRWLLVALLVAGCASKPEEKPPALITESDVRARLTEAQTATTLATLKDERVRAPLARLFAERAREARGRGMRHAVEKVLVGEEHGLGEGLRMVRVFALAHEYSGERFETYLEAVELVGGRLQQALRARVGASGKRLATLEFLDLDRAALRTYLFAERDPPCCPSIVRDTVYAWRGITLEEM